MRQTLLTLALLLGGAALAQTDTTPATTTPPAATEAAKPYQPVDAAAVVAQVGGQGLTGADFERAFRIAVARVLNSQGVPYSTDMLGEFTEARGEFLTQFARDQAVYQLAKRSVQATPAQVDEQLAKARANFSSDAEFAEALKSTGYADESDLRAEIERQTTVQAYLDALKPRFTFGDAVVQGFYNLNRAAFTREAQACVKHVLVKTQAEGQTVLKDVQGGGDFAKIAQEKSQDPGSAAQGGDLGCIAPGDTVAAFDKASFSGPLNQPQLVQTEYGWHVLVVTKRTDAGLTPLTEAAPLIREQLARNAAQKYVDAQIARLGVKTSPEVLGTPSK
ncbi:peptidylprolyl isomerase [Deinococcus hopiensis]|uniref:Peptidyl-prolyl cis-trans isomerase C n=1 Tax=Deinococcus hopiensis KR-140 TaxID=695939 RepID=A0A1W1VKF6_9DEIO|nr:peptidylprolyl isomerase [Deinococcus hopiensis]SMB93837.1 peptidyl-prolyl cis-trans isomerase C [Deinococcus hopiensis KR-140]